MSCLLNYENIQSAVDMTEFHNLFSETPPTKPFFERYKILFTIGSALLGSFGGQMFSHYLSSKREKKSEQRKLLRQIADKLSDLTAYHTSLKFHKLKQKDPESFKLSIGESLIFDMKIRGKDVSNLKKNGELDMNYIKKTHKEAYLAILGKKIRELQDSILESLVSANKTSKALGLDIGELGRPSLQKQLEELNDLEVSGVKNEFAPEEITQIIDKLDQMTQEVKPLMSIAPKKGLIATVCTH